MTNALLLPVFAHVLLIVGLMIFMVLARIAELKKDSTLKEITASDPSAYPGKAKLFGNNFSNQFELPVLFYAVIAFTILTASESSTSVTLAWVFVASRYLHSFVHTGKNIVMQRFLVFGIGVISLLALWISLAVSLYF